MMSWMGYWLGASVLLGCVGIAADRVRRMARRPVRWVWAVSIAACLLAPLLARGARAVWRAIDVPAPVVATDAIQRTAVTPSDGAERPVSAPVPHAPRSISDTILLAAWALVSLALTSRLLLVMHRLRRMRGSWRPAVVGGRSVLVSRDVGPAVVGYRRQAIVLPEWALSLSGREQQLMLLHECEHIGARDPLVLLAAHVAIVLAPWNVVLWWLVRRLRLAIELDCDARVLWQVPDVAAYGALLIDVGRRRSSAPVVPLAALSDPPTFLERRISMLTTHRPRHAVLAAVAIVGLSAIPAAAATVVPQPEFMPPTVAVPWHGASASVDTVAPERVRAMQAALRKLMVAQEMYFSDHGAYASAVSALTGFSAEAGVHVRLNWASRNSYVAEARDDRSPGATCVVHLNWIPRAAWPATALEKQTGADGQIACDGDGRDAHAQWRIQARDFMESQLQALVLPQERARGATGTYPGDASRISGNHFDPAFHFTYLWADTASWAVKAVYDSLPGRSCVVWAGSRPRKLMRTDAQHRFAPPGKVVCDDF